MKFEIRDKTLVVRMKYLPQGIKYINLFGIVLCRYTTEIDVVDWHHEAIHSQQWYETLIIGMLLCYCIEFLYKWIKYRDWDKAYRNISFEQEAYVNECYAGYLETRKHFEWVNYL